jgi:hypothetical protein
VNEAVGAALAVAAVLLLALAGWRLVRRRARLRGPEAAMDAAATLAGFDPVSAVVSDDGAGALAVALDGRVALLRARRGRPAVREVGWAAIRATAAGLEVHAGRRRPVLLAGLDALDARRLAPARARQESARVAAGSASR